jgi:hypothetical protein
MITEAILNINNDALFTIENNDINQITWLNNTTPINANSIQAEITRLQAEYDSLSYARSRKQEYDKLNQFEMQFDDNRDGTTTWVDSINEIKVRFPK